MKRDQNNKLFFKVNERLNKYFSAFIFIMQLINKIKLKNEKNKTANIHLKYKARIT